MKINDFIAYPSSSGLGRNKLKIGKILEMTPKMVKVLHVNKRPNEAKVTTRYPADCILIDSSLISIYVLRHGY